MSEKRESEIFWCTNCLNIPHAPEFPLTSGAGVTFACEWKKRKRWTGVGGNGSWRSFLMNTVPKPVDLTAWSL